MEKFIFQVRNLQFYKHYSRDYSRDYLPSKSLIIPIIQEYLQNVDFSYLLSKFLQQF